MTRARWFRASYVIAMLAALCVQGYLSAAANSATWDEPDHLVAGLAALRTRDFRLNVDHPPLMDLVYGAVAHLSGAPPLSLDDAAWREAQRLRFSHNYLWRGPAAPQAVHLILLARLSTVVCSAALALLVFFWTRRLYGWSAAAFALALYCFEPNLLAHSSLATNDLGAAAGWTLTLYSYWRYLLSPQRGWLTLTGLALGGTLLIKSSGMLLLAVLPLLALCLARPNLSLSTRRFWASYLAIILLALSAVWAGYGFTLGRISGAPGALRIPLGQYAQVIQFQLAHEARGHPSFLLGQVSWHGWWYYFPIAFLVKTPLPLLLLLLLAFVARRISRDEWVLLLPSALYLLAAMLQSLNIGLRHLLPLYPLLIIFCARIWSPGLQERVGRRLQLLTAGLSLWLAVETLSYPGNYLPYFNQLAGGPSRGSAILVDSNLDWGQDLFRLAAWQRAKARGRPLYLSYAGSADPRRYGVKAEPLPGMSEVWPLHPEPGPAAALPRNGLLAISVNCLTFTPYYTWLRYYQPIARAGYSLLIYDLSGSARVPVAPKEPARRG